MKRVDAFFASRLGTDPAGARDGEKTKRETVKVKISKFPISYQSVKFPISYQFLRDYESSERLIQA